ncbi:MAG: glycerol-3-phosphate responsive antiterminator [Oscillospiraceae bacterium]|nr:glycerol-3-phosphate responsive antiterminator [Oscillospiraceae bacterium]
MPIIAGGLIETRQKVTAALSSGALASGTNKKKYPLPEHWETDAFYNTLPE